MALQKQSVNINFSQGLDTKSDPKQVQIGQFLALNNMVFDKAGALVKRDGFKTITKLPNTQQTTLTTQSGNLIATGSNLYAYSQDTDQWLDRGTVQPIGLDVQPLVRVSTSQTAPDVAIASNGLACLTYIDTNVAYYQVSDNLTGQQIVGRTALPATSTNPRVFTLGRYFIITFLVTASGAPHLQYIAVPYSTPSTPTAAADISAQVVSLNSGYDGYVTNNSLYLSWGSTGGNVRTTVLTSALQVGTPVVLATSVADLMSVTADTVNSIIYISFWDTTSNNGYIAGYDLLLNLIVPKTQIITALELNEITSSANAGLLTVIYEVANTYSYAPNAKTDYLNKVTVTQAAVVTGPTTILRSVGLASKAFIDPDTNMIYMVATYGEINQPTYFLIDSNGNIYMRLAYSNGGGYQSNQVLSNVTLIDGVYYTAYLIKSFLASVNKGTELPSGTPVNGIYTQTGINLAKFTINTNGQYSSEIANTLHLTGGMLWQYDGVKPVEQGFQVWPENNTVTTSAAGGNIGAGTYYYVFTYEWTDNQGNLHRSAPSIPVSIVTTGATSTNTLNVPTLRLTYKIAPNPVRIVGYRYSVAQQQYYQFTSLTSPTLNDPAVDSVTITDTLADSAILGNVLLYTTGGVLENIAPPASIASALFKNRLWLIDAEDRNLLYFSKQVISGTPVEMSDLLTVYVAPTSGAQGSTGDCTALTALDDKLIIFKENAIYYLTGLGPDNTGANNDFTDPTFITAAVGCTNPNSIVVMPNGVMFQSNKGIWLLGRDLSTTYIGAPVEQYNDLICYGAKVVPATNQVRFMMSHSVTLMYDFYYGQWGTFNNIRAISETLYQGKDTYLNDLGYVYQETPNFYLDGSTPVVMSFTTSWISLAGLQGFERFYHMFLEGTYLSPFKLNVSLAYDYNASAIQNIIVSPDNYAAKWGGEALWGSGEFWGGQKNVFEARVFPQKQKCETFQITINEVYDPSFSVPPGAGLTLSGINAIIGTKRGFRTQTAKQSFG